jgi:hypothetical protein
VRRVLLLLGLVPGCVSPQTEFPCTQSCQCRRGADRGVCEPAGFCSFDDMGCASGRRYGEGASAALANTCVAGAAFFVAPGGDDGALGTMGHPFGTLQRAVDAASPGTTIIVEDGTYGVTCADNNSFAVALDSAGTADMPITLRARHLWGAVLDAEHTCQSYIGIHASAAYWIIDGFEIVNGYWGGIYSNDAGGSHITISHNHIHDIGRRVDTMTLEMVGVFTNASATDYVIDSNVIHDIGRPNQLSNSFDPLIGVRGARMTITNNVLYGALSGWHVQAQAGFSGTIANNTMFGPNMFPGKSGQVLLGGATGDVVIANNIFAGGIDTAIVSDTWSPAAGTFCQLDHDLAFGAGLASTTIAAGCIATATLAPADPMFVDSDNADFHLQTGSPAIDAAATGPAADLDDVCRPQGAAPDIGAYER